MGALILLRAVREADPSLSKAILAAERKVLLAVDSSLNVGLEGSPDEPTLEFTQREHRAFFGRVAFSSLSCC